MLKAGATRALEDVGQLLPLVYAPPLDLEVVCASPYQARVYATMGKAAWDEGRTVRYEAEDIWDAHRFLTLGLYLLTSPLIPMF